MTYNVFSGTLNPTHFTSLLLETVTKWSIKIKKRTLKNLLAPSRSYTMKLLNQSITVQKESNKDERK